MIDRTWWIWQTQNLPYSLTAASGTLTLGNVPPSANATLDNPVDLGLNGAPVKLGSLLNTLGGLGREFCYTYV
jgi:tyrosinase